MLCVLGLEIVYLYVSMMKALIWDSDDIGMHAIVIMA